LGISLLLLPFGFVMLAMPFPLLSGSYRHKTMVSPSFDGLANALVFSKVIHFVPHWLC